MRENVFGGSLGKPLRQPSGTASPQKLERGISADGQRLVGVDVNVLSFCLKAEVMART